ncbi:MAG TPA: metal ABC transporter substrate-binding protein [Acidimicrobiales bacterium]|nr:metal ABC transporter substrate-binding protein [Acidimicrobiales bacterium]
MAATRWYGQGAHGDSAKGAKLGHTMRPLRPARLRLPAFLAASGLAALGTLGVSGCGSGPAAPRAGGGAGAARSAAPVMVAASVYPLAQLVSYIGGKWVHVVDLAAAGAQPQDLRLGVAQKAELHQAKLVIEVGDGYQPEIEAAARLGPHLAVLPRISRQAEPYEFWLDPYLMADAAPLIAAALVAADPAGKAQFDDGSRDFEAVAASIESDFESTFTQCQDTYFVTADDAFGRMAAAFDLVDVPLNSDGVTTAIATIAQRKLTAVFSETGVPSELVALVATRAGVGVKNLDPMEIAPGPGSPQLSYFSTMEEDLTTMEGPMACDVSGSFS